MTNELADRLANGGRTFDGGMFLDAELLRQVIAALRAEPVAWTAHGIKREDTCVWVQDSDGPWNTSCGKVFEFTNDGPAENEANFCYHCGGALLPEPYSDAAPSREADQRSEAAKVAPEHKLSSDEKGESDRAFRSSDHPTAEPALSAEQIKQMRYYYRNVEGMVSLCDMALSSLTARDEGIEAAAKLAEKWNAHSSLPKHIRALKEASHD